MKVQQIHNTYNPVFNAKLRVLGKYFVKEEYDVLINKADKIGFENDIVELNYTNYRDGSIEFLGQKQPDYLNKISVAIKTRYIPNGEGNGTEWHKESVSDNNYRDFWAKEYNIAKAYIDKLIKKYPNERIGVSIIEN